MTRFKVEVEIQDFGWSAQQTDELRFEFKHPTPTTVTLRNNGTPTSQRPYFAGAHCEVHIDVKAPSKVQKALTNVGADKFQNAAIIGAETRSYVDDLYVGLVATLRSAIAVFRWRAGLRGGPIDPIGGPRLSYSKDGKSWFEISLIRQGAFGWFTPVPTVKSDKAFTAEVVHLVERVGQEPLGHQLFREAWSLRATNPRSALAIGVAAAEVGVKNLIAILVPDARWLMEEIQSPPIDKLVNKFLPTLTVKAHFKGRPAKLPTKFMNLIKAAVECRNKLVHTGAEPPARIKLDEMLEAIRDLLCICDVYAGEMWAAGHISGNSLNDWVEKNNTQ